MLVKITASDIDLQGSVVSGAFVQLQHAESGSTVYLGTASSTSGDFSVEDAEIGRIQGTKLIVTGKQDGAEVSYSPVVVEGLTESNTLKARMGGIVLEATAASCPITFRGSNTAGCQVQASSRQGIHFVGSLIATGVDDTPESCSCIRGMKP